MTVLTFLALWFVAGVVLLVLVVGAVRALIGRQDTEALDLFDDWDADGYGAWLWGEGKPV